ncbi:MAG: hypothetical protein ACRC3A_04285 [Culicoidibacterales bacterium]
MTKTEYTLTAQLKKVNTIIDELRLEIRQRPEILEILMKRQFDLL